MNRDDDRPCYLDVLIRRQDVLRIKERLEKVSGNETEPKRASPGAKPKYDWVAAQDYFHRLLNEHGDVHPDDPDGWVSQAAMERALLTWFCKQNPDRTPAISTIRKYVKMFHKTWLAGFAEN